MITFYLFYHQYSRALIHFLYRSGEFTQSTLLQKEQHYDIITVRPYHMQEFTDKGRLEKIIDIKRKTEESIATKSPLIFTYRKRNEYSAEKRRVVFEKIYSFHSRFYTVGYCLKRKDRRTFRLDRVEAVGGFDLPLTEIPSSVSDPEIPAGAVSFAEAAREIKNESAQQRQTKKAERRGCFITFVVVLVVGGGLLFCWLLGNFPGKWDKVFGKKYDYYTTSLPISYVELKGHLRYDQQPDTIDPGEENRGHTIIKEGNSYTVDGLSGVYPTLYDVVVSINTMVFTEMTGIEDKKLLAIYTDADSDKNGLLSWQEIRSFQMKINRTFRYIQNETALSAVFSQIAAIRLLCNQIA